MDEVDRLHQAYDKTDNVAGIRDAQARAAAELQQAREAALTEGGPTPEEMEAERQRKGIRIQKLLAQGVAGEDIEAALAEEDAKLAGRDKRVSVSLEPSPPLTRGVNGTTFQEALEAAAQDALGDEGVEGWYRGGLITLQWGIAKADEHNGAQIAFSIQLPGEEEPGVLVFDLEEKRLQGWESGLQNADGPRRFAYGLVTKLFNVASQHVSAALHGAITEVQDGIHLQSPDPRPVYDPALHSVDEDDTGDEDHLNYVDEDEAPAMSEEARAFLLRNAEQGAPEVISYGVTPEEAAQVAQRAQEAIEQAMKDVSDD